jgi:hypothetical protein
MHLYIVHIVTITAGYIQMSWYSDESWCLFMGMPCVCSETSFFFFCGWCGLRFVRILVGYAWCYAIVFPLSWNLGNLTSCNPLGHSWPVTGLLDLDLLHILTFRNSVFQHHICIVWSPQQKVIISLILTNRFVCKIWNAVCCEAETTFVKCHFIALYALKNFMLEANCFPWHRELLLLTRVILSLTSELCNHVNQWQEVNVEFDGSRNTFQADFIQVRNG